MSGSGGRPRGVPGGIGLDVKPYVEFLTREYLGNYIRSGGAAVRFVVPGDPEVNDRWHQGIGAAATGGQYLCVAVDAADTKVHLIHELFRAVSRQVPWADLAGAAVRQAYAGLDFPVTRDDALAVTKVAKRYGVHPGELHRSLRRRLELDTLGEPALAPQFRVAMLRLCQAEIGAEVTRAETKTVLSWLAGEPVPVTQLRHLLLTDRIARHNGRAMLLSLSSWLARHGYAGLVLDLDLQRLQQRRPTALADRIGVYYTRSMVLDAYEVLRQLVDATDDLRFALITVSLPVELVTDASRGLPAYSALHQRVADEVRDRRRANPFASLVRLEVRVEATGEGLR
jgi:hypothetical protein